MKEPIFWDIETGPLPEDVLRERVKPNSRLKDPAKIEADIEKKMADGALSAYTGQVLLVGIKSGRATHFLEGREQTILESFWACLRGHFHHPWVGFNTHRFDLPFLVRRSMVYGIPIPHTYSAVRYWPSNQIDLMAYWQCGDRHEMIGMDRLARFLGLEGKKGDGALFHKLIRENKAKALEYVQGDLDCTERIWRRIGREHNVEKKRHEAIHYGN